MSHHQVQVLDAPAPARVDGSGPPERRQHVLDRKPWHPEGSPVTPGAEPAQRTLCGEEWDIIDRAVKAPFCERCRDIMTARGDAHYIPAMLRGGGA